MPKLHTKVELVEVDKIQPYDKNAKVHSKDQVTKLAKTIEEHGWDQPIVVDGDYVVIKGHGRRLAALSLGLKKVPVVVRTDMSPEQVKAARLADNRVALGDFDVELVQAELAELAAGAYDLSTLGFDEKELAFMTEELDALNMDQAIGDLNETVERQTQATDAVVASVSGRKVPIAKALGFGDVPGSAERTVSQFMAIVEQQAAPLTGAAAFLAFAQQLIAAAE